MLRLRCLPLVVVSLLLFAATSCDDRAPEAAAGPQGYLAVGSNGVIFVQWTEAGGVLSGQMQDTFVRQPDRLASDNSNSSFTGIRNGDAISLQLSSKATWTGKLQGDVLTLVIPDASGPLSIVTFKKATVADYNRAAADMLREVRSAQASATAIAQEKERRERVEKARRAADQAAATEQRLREEADRNEVLIQKLCNLSSGIPEAADVCRRYPEERDRALRNPRDTALTAQSWALTRLCSIAYFAVPAVKEECDVYARGR